MSPAICWFRQDLRLADNPALARAAATGQPVLCLYVLDDETPGVWRIGGASRWWLHHSLASLARDLAAIGGRLLLRRGNAARIICDLVETTGARSVVWNRCYEPAAVARDQSLKTALRTRGVTVESFNASLLAEPWMVKTRSGTPFRVFTPFWRAAQASLGAMSLFRPPVRLDAGDPSLETDKLADWQLLPTARDWAAGFAEPWMPGERGAQASLARFLARLPEYPEGRDRPDREATSRLSPHLHFGEISPRQVWNAVHSRPPGNEKFLAEIGWREFAYHLLFHNPALPEEPLDRKFLAFPWSRNDAGFAAWCQGRTGYPIVDAGMRELWTTGWMHNRVRMIAASFLVKHLGVDWRRGATWFWDTLVDADLASNSASWQWVAGCGTDSAPFFRIFNPVLQGEKFDPDGSYVRKWIPELRGLDAKFIHKPWTAQGSAPAYPEPILELSEARERALLAYRSLTAP